MSACIWYVSKYVTLPSSGGVGTRSFNLMREIRKLGHRTVILTSDSNHLAKAPEFEGPHLKKVIEGVDVCWVRTFKYSGAKSLRRILSWLDFEWHLWRLPKDDLPRPDAVIVSSLSLLTIFNGLLLRQRYGCRLVFEVRDIWPLTIIEEGGFSPRNPFVMALAMVERLAYRRADAIVGLMPILKAHVDEVTSRHGPVYHIPLGVDEEMMAEKAPLPAGFAESYIPADKFVVCHAGTIGITNALEPLFACARAMQDEPDIHFLLVGEGGLKADFETMCADLPNVTFAPAVPKNAVQAVLERCDLLYFSVHVSKVWRYGLALNKVIDYMLAGKPIVASYTGHRSMVEEAGAGTSVPAGDPSALRLEILRLAALPEAARARTGAAGREWLLRCRRYKTLAEDYLRLALPDRAGN